ncbi:hypothetical protein ADUPG1_011052 [Aduncisulcus paluster]|uniref:CN hydrolase domain-containing protein n=1 Tax=Aduncisulcus paluster TaxID=2918883 RepID=A0ABQ5JW39_9EUKA|nr:hypothetical protein ADUPG1_011052 [Aduncisulcus paluster]
MSQKLSVGLIQYDSLPNIQENIDNLSTFIPIIKKSGVSTLMLPELVFSRGNKKDSFFAADQSELCLEFSKYLSKSCNIHLLSPIIRHPSHAGSTQSNKSKLLNSLYSITPDGEIINIYDKMHMFSFSTHEGYTIRESKSFSPGSTTCKTILPGSWHCGMSICYDMRFPELYRSYMRESPVDVSVIPSCITHETGTAHWHTLTKARSIENQTYVLCPATCGVNRSTGQCAYGHSIAYDPWGKEMTGKFYKMPTPHKNPQSKLKKWIYDRQVSKIKCDMKCGLDGIEQGLWCVELDKDVISKTRRKLCVLDDAKFDTLVF